MRLLTEYLFLDSKVSEGLLSLWGSTGYYKPAKPSRAGRAPCETG
jgi:hypothetical protein